MKKIFNNEQEKYIRDNYQFISYKEIANKFNCTERQVRSWISNHGLRKNRIFNNRFFQHIDNPTKAYWLGFIYADGYVVKAKHGTEFGIELQRNDRYALEYLNNLLGNKHIIYDKHECKQILNNKDISETYSSILRVYSKPLVNDLISNGIVPNKTYSDIFPIVKNKLFFDFLRGYIDGDGCLYINKNLLYIHITSSNKYILNNIKSFLNKKYNISPKLYFENERKFRLYWTNKDDVKKTLDLIYKNKKEFCLKRKYEIYNNYYYGSPS